MRERNLVIAEDLQKIVSVQLPWEQLFGKTILVTGANGFLPAYMIKTMLYLNEVRNAKITVVALVRNYEKAKKRFQEYISRNDILIIMPDIAKPLEINLDIDIIIHAASQASPKYYVSDPVGTLVANSVGTFNLLNLAKEKKVTKFLFFSSSEVYGNLINADNINENEFGTINPLDIRSCYSESKRMGETMCISFYAQYKIPIVIVRPFHTYGPGLSLDDGRVFADFVSNIVNGQDIIMSSDGNAVRSFCYISDATIGFYTALFYGKHGLAYNIGNPLGAISIKKLAQLLVGLYPNKNISGIFEESVDKKYLQSNINKLIPSISKINELGWSPSISLPDGFKRTIESFNI